MKMTKFQPPSLKIVAVNLTQTTLANFGKYIVRYLLHVYNFQNLNELIELLPRFLRKNTPQKFGETILKSAGKNRENTRFPIRLMESPM